MTSDGLAFGIGSIFFQIASTDISEWPPSVAETLEAVPSVGNLEMRFPSNLIVKVIVGQPSDSHTYPAIGAMKFNITIPARLHGDLTRGRIRTNPGELFDVTTIYESYHPVTFVISQRSDGLTSGSQGIVLVREFLKRELHNRPGSARMVTLGPSPLHVDASIEPADQADTFTLSSIARRGYDSFVFNYSKTSFTSPYDAAEHLFPLLAEELSLFYDLVERRNRRVKTSYEISNEAQRLIGQYQDTGMRTRLTRFFSSGPRMRHLTLKAINAEYNIQRDASLARDDIDRLYAKSAFPCFRKYLEKEIEPTNAVDLSNAKDIVSILSQSRSQQVEVASLFLSALAGGLAGALISVLVH